MITKNIILEIIKNIQDKTEDTQLIQETQYLTEQVTQWEQTEWNENKTKLYNYLNTTLKELNKTSKPTILTKKELQDLEIKSNIEQKFKTNKQEFLKLFNYYSVDNEMMAKMLYHTFLSVICNQANVIFRNTKGKRIKPITHQITIQNTRSGKDEALDFIISLMHDVNDLIKKHILAGNKAGLKIIRIKELSGAESAEALLDRYETDKNGLIKIDKKTSKPKKCIPGILSRHDLITSAECSFLFKEGHSERQNKGGMLLKALEGKGVNKELISWGSDGVPYDTDTIFNGVFIGMSRPISNVRADYAYSGLQQRGLNCCRNLGHDDRKRMLAGLTKIGLLTNKEWDEIEERKQKLANDFFNMLLFLKNCNIMINEEERDEIVKLVETCLDELYDDINDTVLDKDHSHIMQGFVSSFHSLINALACHNCVCRFDKNIGLVDFQNGMSLLKESYQNLKGWICENVSVSYVSERKVDKAFDVVMGLFKTKDFFTRNFLVTTIIRKIGCNNDRAYKYVKFWESNNILVEVVKKVGDKEIKVLSLKKIV
jgi:hypothetical protein